SALRAGASYAVGTALLGLLLAIAHFLDLIADQDALLRAAQLIVPGVMIALGAEFVLNFVLNLYRPRRPGEEDRPAFDSRLLGLLAAPDKIAENVGEALNYQFGVRVTETWFYRLVKVWWPAFVGAAVLVVWSMTAFVVIREDQRAIILANGRPVAENVGSGLHLKWPWPFGTVYIPESVVELRDADDRGGVTVERFRSKTATGVRTMNLGTNPPSPSAPAILWTNEHTDVEIFNIVQPTRLAELDPPDATEDDQGGADLAIVALEAPVLYSVRDVGAFDRFAVPEDRDELLKLMGQREVTQMLGSRSIDEILGGDRMAFAHRVRERLELAFGENGLDAGIEILSITTGVVHPPQKTATGFERVVQAVPIRDRRIEQARK
ncbi:MAG: SPFH domain-containing protein, partial [Planctomycetota bacterium]